jgi:hypothetical protein
VLAKVISGGQAGADQAALRAAKAAGVPTGGYAACGWATEDGPAPWLRNYGLTECAASGYPARTRLNVAAADAVLWLGDRQSPGGKLTLSCARAKGIPSHVVPFGAAGQVGNAVLWLRGLGDGAVLLVAGNRESSRPGIGAWAETFVGDVLRLLREDGR